jgi:hypothetical protein
MRYRAEEGPVAGVRDCGASGDVHCRLPLASSLHRPTVDLGVFLMGVQDIDDVDASNSNAVQVGVFRER